MLKISDGRQDCAPTDRKSVQSFFSSLKAFFAESEKRKYMYYVTVRLTKRFDYHRATRFDKSFGLHGWVLHEFKLTRSRGKKIGAVRVMPEPAAVGVARFGPSTFEGWPRLAGPGM